MGGLFRLVHPFPSTLDAVAAAMVALIAGADILVAGRLALAMLLLQFAIGTANDVADVESDRVGHPWKPIPAGRVTGGDALVVFAGCAGGGLFLAASVSTLALVIAAVGLVDGLIYDLSLKGTPLSWLPFAGGVALLPVYGWVGAVGRVPGVFWLVVPMALTSGAILALGNALGDLDSDRAASVESIATALGRARALIANAILLAGVQVAAALITVISGPPLVAVLAEAAGVVSGWAGVLMATSPDGRLNRLAWEVQALGILLLSTGLLVALSSGGFLGTT